MFDRIGYEGSVENIEFNDVRGNITGGGVVSDTPQGTISNVNISGSVDISGGVFGGVVGGYTTVDVLEQ